MCTREFLFVVLGPLPNHKIRPLPPPHRGRGREGSIFVGLVLGNLARGLENYIRERLRTLRPQACSRSAMISCRKSVECRPGSWRARVNKLPPPAPRGVEGQQENTLSFCSVSKIQRYHPAGQKAQSPPLRGVNAEHFSIQEVDGKTETESTGSQQGPLRSLMACPDVFARLPFFTTPAGMTSVAFRAKRLPFARTPGTPPCQFNDKVEKPNV